ncbi:MAG TPA: sialidase family protein [Vicinamibacterales bacterium]|nr:sialidase family protein [Vicinamibacterales bacterium]
MTWIRTLSALTIAATAACSSPTRGRDTALDIQPLELTAPAGSSLPNLSAFRQPAIVSWVETVAVDNAPARATLKFAERTANGWTAPRSAASGSDWFVNSADVPSVVRVDDHTLAAHWLQNTDVHREAYDIKMSWSKDNGATWAPPVSPHHDGTTTQHGFATLFPTRDAGVGVVWLDGRATTDPENDNMSVRAAMFDAGGRQLSETLVDERACECCPTAVAVTDAGPVAVYRDRSATEIRDIASSRLVNGAWTPAALVHADNWHIEACPVNGPAASAQGSNVAVAWMTATGDEGHSFAAFSQDGGATFGPPIRLDEAGSLGRVGIALLDGGSAIATWIEFSDGKGQLRARRVERSGGRGPAQVVASTADRASGYPRIARSGTELLFAWTETMSGQPRVRTAAARGF